MTLATPADLHRAIISTAARLNLHCSAKALAKDGGL